MTDEGVIKFHCQWEQAPPVSESLYGQINPWRQALYNRRLIGADPQGIGYGNLSFRDPDELNTFIITGSATGGVAQLTPDHYTRVTAYDLDDNSLTCRGPVRASSESLTHASLYSLNPAIKAVAHIHSKDLWQRLIHTVPTTDASVPYGTVAMGCEMARLYRETDLPGTRLLVMAGHRDGLIAFGDTLDEAVSRLLSCEKGG